jgi:DNA polymerase III delta prime subunit
MVRGAVAGVAFDFYAGRDWDLFLPNHAVWRSNPPPLKPRVPNAEDADQSSRCWIDHHTPGGLASVLGQEMPKTSSTLRKLRGRVDDQSFGSHLLISGEDGSGKRALGLAFARDFLGSFQMNPDAKAATSRSRTTAKLLRSHILVLEAAQTLDSKKLESRMRDYLGGRDSFDGILPKILVLRNMHQVKPSAQQVLCAADDASKGRLKMILCGPPSTKLITTLASRVQVMSINKLDKTDSLKVTLQVLSRERVGFDIVALQQLFSLLWPTDLKNIISTVQRYVALAQHLNKNVPMTNASQDFCPAPLY